MNDMEILTQIRNEVALMLRHIVPAPWLYGFDVHLVEHCNLNCRGCMHYSSVSEKSFLDLATFERDLERIAYLTRSKVDQVRLLGGEPLLHPDLLQFFPIARKLFPNSTILLITNGILLSKQQGDFWRSCQEYKITIVITKHPVERKQEVIDEKLKNYGIEVQFWGGDYLHRYPLNLQAKESYPATWLIPINFIKCRTANNCTFLRDGKLYTCCFPPNVHHFNRYFNQNVEVCEADFIDIYKAQNIEEILLFLARPIPFCRYCDIDARQYDLEWRVSKKDIKEWMTERIVMPTTIQRCISPYMGKRLTIWACGYFGKQIAENMSIMGIEFEITDTNAKLHGEKIVGDVVVKPWDELKERTDVVLVSARGIFDEVNARLSRECPNILVVDFVKMLEE